MRVSIPATKSQLAAVSVELRAMGAIFDKLSKAWRIDQHLVLDALELVERGQNASLRAVISVERGDSAAQPLNAAELYAVSVYCAENRISSGCTLQGWQIADALRIRGAA